MKPKFIGVSRALAFSGCTDFRFVDEEDLYKGSEIHRMAELRLKGKLDRKSVPITRRGYLEAIDKFLRENGFIPTHVEQLVEDKSLGICGRLDAAGVMKGKRTVVDFKTGAINPAVALQLCLYGHCLDPSHWWERVAVQLRPDGKYSLGKPMPIRTWHADLTTALAACRVAQWKRREGLV